MFFYYNCNCNNKKKKTPPGGLEPPTFRLTAERASRLRHGGLRSNKEMGIREVQRSYLGLETSCLDCVCGFVQSLYVTYRVNIVQNS